MCTLAIAFKVISDVPLVLAGNRDEFTARTFLRPHVWPKHPGLPALFAGKDLKQGGTWLGINEHGLLITIINRYTGQRDPSLLSRGNLAVECLHQDSLNDVKTYLRSQDLSQYNPFTLLAYAHGEAWVATNYPGPSSWPLERGIHILTNADPRDNSDAKRNYLIATYLSPAPRALSALHTALVSLCKDHTWLQGFPSPACVHMEGYGTVSSSLVMLAEETSKSRFEYCEGPPCKGVYEDLTAGFLSVVS